MRTVRLARLLTGSATAAEDLAQEAFLRVHRSRERVIDAPAYLNRVTVNVCHNWHRSNRREARGLLRLETRPADVSIEAREFDRTLTSMPYRQRAVIVMRYWLDLDEASIAAALGCRPGTVKSLHSRALDRLRKEVSA